MNDDRFDDIEELENDEIENEDLENEEIEQEEPISDELQEFLDELEEDELEAMEDVEEEKKKKAKKKKKKKAQEEPEPYKREDTRASEPQRRDEPKQQEYKAPAEQSRPAETPKNEYDDYNLRKTQERVEQARRDDEARRRAEQLERAERARERMNEDYARRRRDEQRIHEEWTAKQERRANVSEKFAQDHRTSETPIHPSSTSRSNEPVRTSSSNQYEATRPSDTSRPKDISRPSTYRPEAYKPSDISNPSRYKPSETPKSSTPRTETPSTVRKPYETSRPTQSTPRTDRPATPYGTSKQGHSDRPTYRPTENRSGAKNDYRPNIKAITDNRKEQTYRPAVKRDEPGTQSTFRQSRKYPDVPNRPAPKMIPHSNIPTATPGNRNVKVVSYAAAGSTVATITAVGKARVEKYDRAGQHIIQPTKAKTSASPSTQPGSISIRFPVKVDDSGKIIGKSGAVNSTEKTRARVNDVLNRVERRKNGDIPKAPEASGTTVVNNTFHIDRMSKREIKKEIRSGNKTRLSKHSIKLQYAKEFNYSIGSGALKVSEGIGKGLYTVISAENTGVFRSISSVKYAEKEALGAARSVIELRQRVRIARGHLQNLGIRTMNVGRFVIGKDIKAINKVGKYNFRGSFLHSMGSFSSWVSNKTANDGDTGGETLSAIVNNAQNPYARRAIKMSGRFAEAGANKLGRGTIKATKWVGDKTGATKAAKAGIETIKNTETVSKFINRADTAYKFVNGGAYNKVKGKVIEKAPKQLKTAVSGLKTAGKRVSGVVNRVKNSRLAQGIKKVGHIMSAPARFVKRVSVIVSAAAAKLKRVLIMGLGGFISIILIVSMISTMFSSVLSVLQMDKEDVQKYVEYVQGLQDDLIAEVEAVAADEKYDNVYYKFPHKQSYNNIKELLCMTAVRFDQNWPTWIHFFQSADVKNYIETIFEKSHTITYDESDYYYCDDWQTCNRQTTFSCDEPGHRIDNSGRGGCKYYWDEDCSTDAEGKEHCHSYKVWYCDGDHLECSGTHMDVDITIDTLGWDDIFAIDPPDPENGWAGWTDDNIAWAKNLYDQDWYELYEVILSDGNFSSIPMLEEEQEAIMEKILEQYPDLSIERQTLIANALQLAGRVPYFWGGGHHQGLSPEIDAAWGTELRQVMADGYDKQPKGSYQTYGLDCSGFARWVMLTTFGKDCFWAGSEGQRKMSMAISKDQLLPGDFANTGNDGHIGMYLYTEGGKMYFIHCSPSVNGVNVNAPGYFTKYFRPKELAYLGGN